MKSALVVHRVDEGLKITLIGPDLTRTLRCTRNDIVGTAVSFARISLILGSVGSPSRKSADRIHPEPRFMPVAC